MIDKRSNDQWLDAILANPARVSDQGFTRSVHSELRSRQVRRRGVFIATACSWVVVAAMILASQETPVFFQRLQTMVATALGWISENSALELIALIPSQLYLQAILLLVLIVVFGFYALLSSHPRL